MPQMNVKQIYERPQLPKFIYGQSLKISLDVHSLHRYVVEDPKKVDFERLQQFTTKITEIELFDALYRTLHSYTKAYNRDLEDVVDAYLRVSLNSFMIVFQCSGDVEGVKSYLEGKRVTEWSAIEDFALSKEDITCNDYQILVKTKGITEIEKRKAFLG